MELAGTRGFYLSVMCTLLSLQHFLNIKENPWQLKVYHYKRRALFSCHCCGTLLFNSWRRKLELILAFYDLQELDKLSCLSNSEASFSQTSSISGEKFIMLASGSIRIADDRFLSSWELKSISKLDIVVITQYKNILRIDQNYPWIR